MATDGPTFDQWLREAKIDRARLTSEQIALLEAAYRFFENRGGDYYSRRVLSHFLLHCRSGLKVAQVARILGVSRPTASRQQNISSKEMVQAAHHRMAGRPHGKLLPRYAGPIAQFLITHPKASRWDILEFIERTWQVHVSTVALYKFMKKYGLDRATVPCFGGRYGNGRTGGRPGRGGVRGEVAHAAGGFFFAPTQYAGAFLLLPVALNWLAIAEQCFRDEYGSLRRGLLTSVFALVVGLERMFHLDQMEDAGFALLTGGRRCPSRHLVGAWRRHLAWYEVDRFCRRTSPWQWIAGEDAVVSFDEHSIPRWTHKFLIPKGFVTTRNKYMRCEKLYYGYDVVHDRYLSIRGTPGRVELRDVALPMTQQVLARGRPRHLHALFDAGAGKSDANVRALLDLAEKTPNLDVTLRACRYPSRVKLWKAIAGGGVCRLRGRRGLRGCPAQGNSPGRDQNHAQG